MEPHLPRNAPRRAGETQQKRCQNPVRQRPLTPVQEGLGEVVEGSLTTMAPVAFAPGSILVCAPLSNVGALAAWTLQRSVFPPQCMDSPPDRFLTHFRMDI